MRLDIRPGDRTHMLVWRAHPTAPGDPGWRAWWAINGVPLRFGRKFPTWREAMDYATSRAQTGPGRAQELGGAS